MQYNQYVIETFETARGKWWARVDRSEGHGLARKLVTNSEAQTEADALLAAVDLIEAGSIERFWQRFDPAELQAPGHAIPVCEPLRPRLNVGESEAMAANLLMTLEQAATLERLAKAAYELDAFKPKLTRIEAGLRIAALTAKLKLLDGPPHTL
jgi:hypothetical protein